MSYQSFINQAMQSLYNKRKLKQDNSEYMGQYGAPEYTVPITGVYGNNLQNTSPSSQGTGSSTVPTPAYASGIDEKLTNYLSSYFDNVTRMNELEAGGYNIGEQAQALMEQSGGYQQLPFYQALQQILDEGGYGGMIPNPVYAPQPIKRRVR